MKKILATSLVTLLLVGCGGTGPTEPQLSIEITPRLLTLMVGEEVTMSAVARDVDGNSVGATLEWWSTKERVASVSTDGVVRGISACETVVFATVGQLESNKVKVTVVAGSANSAESAACGG